MAGDAGRTRDGWEAHRDEQRRARLALTPEERRMALAGQALRGRGARGRRPAPCGAKAPLKPAHTHFVDLVEPLPPVVPDHWEIGVSEVGVATVTH
jgi:hypothetical protein